MLNFICHLVFVLQIAMIWGWVPGKDPVDPTNPTALKGPYKVKEVTYNITTTCHMICHGTRCTH